MFRVSWLVLLGLLHVLHWNQLQCLSIAGYLSLMPHIFVVTLRLVLVVALVIKLEAIMNMNGLNFFLNFLIAFSFSQLEVIFKCWIFVSISFLILLKVLFFFVFFVFCSFSWLAHFSYTGWTAWLELVVKSCEVMVRIKE